MRAIWKGAISFGLVNIPVGLYSATKSTERVKFRMLRDSDHSPIKYKRVAEADEKEVPWEHIVKGYEYEKGSFVVMTEADFDRVQIKSNQTVDIREFVQLAEIDPMFFDEPYFLAPEKGGDKGYALLREALKQSGKVGIAKVVLKTREYVAAVKPLGKALILELLHFADELADPNALPIPGDISLGKKEIDMAKSLIDAMTDKWKSDKYQDEYTRALMQVIEEKVASGGKALPREKAKAAPSKVVNIVELLQKSLAEARTSTRKSQRKARKAAA